MSRALLASGLKRGDKIAIIALNQPEWLLTFFGAVKIGIGVVALNVRYRSEELNYMLNNSKAKALVSLSELGGFSYADFFKNNQEKFLYLEKYIFLGDFNFKKGVSFEDFLKEKSDLAKFNDAKSLVKDNDTAAIIYTSGTTGKPKGANLTHKSMISSAQAQAKHIECTENDIIMGGHLPLNHVGGDNLLYIDIDGMWCDSYYDACF